MPRHRPNAAHVFRDEQHLAVIATEDLVSQIKNACGNVDPHESEVPLQRAAEPTSNRKRLGPVQQIFLWNLGPETRERAKDLQAAAGHHKEGNRIYPMREPHWPPMLINSLYCFPALR